MAAGAAEDGLPAPRVREVLASRLKLDTGLAYGGNAASLLCLVPTNLLFITVCASRIGFLLEIGTAAVCFLLCNHCWNLLPSLQSLLLESAFLI